MKITYVFRSPTNSANVEQFSSKNSRKMAFSTVFKISESESLSAQTSSEKESCGGIVSRQIILNAYYYIYILMVILSYCFLHCFHGLIGVAKSWSTCNIVFSESNMIVLSGVDQYYLHPLVVVDHHWSNWCEPELECTSKKGRNSAMVRPQWLQTLIL